MDNSFMASRVTSLKASAIREIFKLVGQSGIISLAGGNPSAELFPTNELAEISSDILKIQGAQALQYGVTEGYFHLREKVRVMMKNINVLSEGNDLIITSGGQQAIDLAAKVLLEEGETVVVEAPSFIGGLNSFRSYNAKLVGVQVQDDGLDVDALEAILQKQKIKLLYTIPTFQNPTGITMSLEKRKRIIDLANKYDFYILEDNPYGDLRFEGENLPTIKSMDKEGRVIYAGSFSKIISPGLRVGFVVCREDILDRIIVCKQVSDVHTPLLNQMIINSFLDKYDLNEYIDKIKKFYGEKCKLMIDCIDKEFPSFCTHTNPQGGIFLWCNLPKEYNTKELMAKCVEKKVAFVPGATCMVNIEEPCSMFRLNYSMPTKAQIEEGTHIIAGVLKNG